MTTVSEFFLREVSQEDDLGHIVALELRNRGLTELGPIDKCRGLKVLDLGFNQLKSVKGLEGLDRLKELRLSDNKLTSVTALQRLFDLHTLALDGNNFTQLEGLHGLRGLKVLNVSFNQLSSLSSLGRLTSLEVLHAAGNQITDLEALSGCPALRVVNACSNRLQHLKGLARCASLQELHVADNKLTDLSGLKPVASSLEILDLSGNALTSLSGLCSLPKLTELYARENCLEGVEGLAARVPALELLDLASNRLSASVAKLSAVLSPLTELGTLQLCGNTRLGATDAAADPGVPGSGGGGYVAAVFTALPSLEVCDGQERAQVLVLAEEEAREAGPSGGEQAAAGASDSVAELDPTIAEMEAFRKRLGIRTYAPQFAGRPGSASGSGAAGRPGSSAGRPGSSSGLRPGTASGRPGTGSGRPGSRGGSGRPPMPPANRIAGGVVMDPEAFAAALGNFRDTMATYSTSLKSVLSQMRANLRLPVYEAAQKLKGEGVTQLPSMPLAPEFAAAPRHNVVRLLQGEDRADVEQREEALQMYERLFGGGGDGSSGSPSSLSTPVLSSQRLDLTGDPSGIVAGGMASDEEEDEIELRSSAPGTGVAVGPSSSSRPGSSGSALAGAGAFSASPAPRGPALRVKMPAKPTPGASPAGGFAAHKPALLARKASAGGALSSPSTPAPGPPGSPSPAATGPAGAAARTPGTASVLQRPPSGGVGVVSSPASVGMAAARATGVAASPRGAIAGVPAASSGGSPAGASPAGLAGGRTARPASAGRSQPRKLNTGLAPRTGGKMLAGGGS